MKSIRFKLWSGMMLLVFFMLILLWLFQIVFLEQFYLNNQINSLTQNSTDWVLKLEDLKDLSLITTNSELKDELGAFAFTHHLSLKIIDNKSNVLYQETSSSEQQSPNMFKKSISEIGKEAQQTGKTVQTTLIHPRFGNTFLVIGAPIFIVDQGHPSVAGVLIVNAPLAPVSDTADILKKQLILITIILLFVSFILSFIMSRHFSKPILRISQVAKEIAKGNFDIKIDKKGQDEIGQLAININEMGQELKRTDQLRKELIGNISHELRTPLSLIRGYAETIRDVSGEQAEKREKHIEIIIEESKRLGFLIEDILSLSQLEAGAIKLEQKEFLLNELVTKVVKGFEDAAQKRHISIVREGDFETLVLGDERRLEQVLYNLMGNAFQHIDDEGQVRISVEPLDTCVRVSIEDTGVGIPKEALDSIWERYYKVPNKGDHEKNKGTGLGLAIVKSILVAHAVEFGVESSVGTGTSFWFKLKKGEK